jgi:hypothetical protein
VNSGKLCFCASSLYIGSKSSSSFSIK